MAVITQVRILVTALFGILKWLFLPGEREQGRMKLAMKRKNVEIGEIKERQNAYENNVFRYTQKIEQIKQQMKWSQKVSAEIKTLKCNKSLINIFNFRCF